MNTSLRSTRKTCYAVSFPERLRYESALELQMRICELKKADFAADVLMLLEHPPVITLGRNADYRNLLASAEMLQARGVTLHRADRGGDITFHGPGQLVGYPLLKLEPHEQDTHRYMRNLEEAIIRLLGEFGIPAGREENLTGVWTDAGKICAMGVHISRWVTRHGFALNVNTDLSFYDLIVPCGLVGRRVHSMQKALGHEVGLLEVAEKLTDHFGQVLQRDMKRITPEELARLI